MEQNVGDMDRIVRILLGVVLLALGVAGLGEVLSTGVPLGVVLALAGVVLIGTGVMRSCLLYNFIGVDTSGR
jgi:hypothetical protein